MSTDKSRVLAGYRLPANEHLTAIRCCGAQPSHPGTNDTKPLHAELESGTIHPQTRGRPACPGDEPLCLFQCREDVLAFCLLHSHSLRSSLASCGTRMKTRERYP